jgi:hypothetical protein
MLNAYSLLVLAISLATLPNCAHLLLQSERGFAEASSLHQSRPAATEELCREVSGFGTLEQIVSH